MCCLISLGVSFSASLVLEAPLCFHFSTLFVHFHFCESFLKGFSLNYIFIAIYWRDTMFVFFIY